MQITKITVLHTIEAGEITRKRLISFFLQNPQRSLYVVDAGGCLVGLFTKGAFMKQLRSGVLSPNTVCKRLLEGPRVQEEAQKIFLENEKIRAIPVTEGKGRLLYELALTSTPPPTGGATLLSEQYRALEELEACSLGKYLFWLGYSRVVLFVQFAKEKELLELESALAKHSVTLIPVISKEAPPDSRPNDLLVYEGDLAQLKMWEKDRKAGYGAICWDQLLGDAWRYVSITAVQIMRIVKCEEEQVQKYYRGVEKVSFINCSTGELPIVELYKKALGAGRVEVLWIEEEETLADRIAQITPQTPVLGGFWHRYHAGIEVPIKHHLVRMIKILDALCRMDWDAARSTVARLDRAGVSLLLVNIGSVFSQTPLFPQEKERIKRYHLLGELLEDTKDGLRHLNALWGERGPALVRELSTMGKVLKTTPALLKDGSGRYVNIFGGRRKTCHQPPTGTECQTIYLFGQCYVFGSFCSDEETIASRLQEQLREMRPIRRVVNCGQPSVYLPDILSDIAHTAFCAGDVVVIFDHMFSGSQAERYGFSYLMLPVAKLPKERPEMFFNGIPHHTGIATQIIADLLMKELPWDQWTPKETDSNTPRRRLLPLPTLPKDLEEDMARFVAMLSAQRLPDAENKVIGALVMNCNPFTLGHRYLVEYASAACDWLYLFVVEEDRSFFPFRERLALIEAGTRDIKNLTVLPSGRCILSLQTMPEYFSKEQDNTQQVDPSSDIGLFAQFIAPALGINCRFVGEEPTDLVTRQYNEGMKAILPQYGIEVTEIPRKELSGAPISASRVRTLLQTGDFEGISKLVPETTLRFLEEKYNGSPPAPLSTYIQH